MSAALGQAYALIHAHAHARGGAGAFGARLMEKELVKPCSLSRAWRRQTLRRLAGDRGVRAQPKSGATSVFLEITKASGLCEARTCVQERASGCIALQRSGADPELPAGAASNVKNRFDSQAGRLSPGTMAQQGSQPDIRCAKPGPLRVVPSASSSAVDPAGLRIVYRNYSAALGGAGLAAGAATAARGSRRAGSAMKEHSLAGCRLLKKRGKQTTKPVGAVPAQQAPDGIHQYSVPTGGN
jgi:hypothetical protein